MNSSADGMLANCSCSYPATVTWMEKYVNGFSLPIIGIFGLMGNLLTVILFRYIVALNFWILRFDLRCQQQLKSTFFSLLTVLAIVDALCLILLVTDHSFVEYWKLRPTFYIYILPLFWYPLKNILMSTEAFLIMSIAVERFLAVCR